MISGFDVASDMFFKNSFSSVYMEKYFLAI